MPHLGGGELIVLVLMACFLIIVIFAPRAPYPQMRAKGKIITLRLRRIDPSGAAALGFCVGIILSILGGIGAMLNLNLQDTLRMLFYAVLTGLLGGIVGGLTVICLNFSLNLIGGWKFEFERPVPSKPEDTPESPVSARGNTPEREAEIQAEKRRQKIW